MRIITAAALIILTLLAVYRPAGAGAAEADLTERLRALIREGERRRAADRWFLDELRAITRRNRRPSSREVVRDDFRDGDYTRSPVWRVASGRFDVTRRMGLTSIVEARGEAPPAETKAGRDIASALLGELLQRSLGGRDRGARSGASDLAEIFLPRKLSNAFTIRMEIAFRGTRGRLVFGPYDGRRRDRGYRLAFSPGEGSGLELYRATRRGPQLIAAYKKPVKAREGRAYVIEWIRERNGEMIVLLDGQELLRAPDLGQRGVFNGFLLENSGGHFGLREITIHGD